MYRPRMELSKKNKYYVEKNRKYELMYFCRQYDLYIKELLNISYYPNSNSMYKEKVDGGNLPNPTEDIALRKTILSSYISLIESCVRESDPQLYKWLLIGVTRHVSYTELEMKYQIPCCKETYYDRYNRFWWLLSKKRM